jgi:O-antigen/teichoic acid export membrane protein
MFKLIKNINSKEIYKVFSINGLRVFIQLLIGFISSKAIAFFIGIAGMGVVGLVKNFISFLNFLLLLGTQNGIVSKLASQKKIKNREVFIVSLFWFFLFFSILISFIFLFFFDFINQYFFAKQINNRWLIFLFAISIPFQTISLFFNSVLNGQSEYKKVALIGVITNVFTLCVSVFLMSKYSVTGAIIGLIASSIIMFAISTHYFLKVYTIKTFLKPFKFAKKDVFSLMNYSIMSLVSIIISISFSYFLRIKIINKFSLEHAGYYEAVLRISGFYMIFINTFVTFYFLPELAKCNSKEKIAAITKEYYKYIIPVFCIGLIFLLLLIDFLVPLFFNKDFLVITPFIKYQVLLDLIKSICLILGIRFFAFGNSKGFLLTEIASFAINFILFIIAMEYFEFEGVWYSQILSSFLYFFILLVYFKNNNILKT